VRRLLEVAYRRLLRLMRVAPIITLAPLRRSAMPNPNSTSAPVDGVVVLAPRTPVEGFDVLLDELDTVEVDVDGSVTVVVRPVEDCELVVCDDVTLLEVVVGVLTVDDVVLLDELVSLDDEVVCEVDDELLLDVVLCVLLVELCVLVVVVLGVLLVDDVVEFVEDVVVVLSELPAHVLESTKSPLPAESSAPVPSASVLSPVIPVSGTNAHVRVAPPSASTTAPLYPPFFGWT
jgi:hypothetical protein